MSILEGKRESCYFCGMPMKAWKPNNEVSVLWGVIKEHKYWVELVIDSIQQPGFRQVSCERNCKVLAACTNSIDGVPSQWYGPRAPVFVTVPIAKADGGDQKIWIQHTRLYKECFKIYDETTFSK